MTETEEDTEELLKEYPIFASVIEVNTNKTLVQPINAYITKTVNNLLTSVHKMMAVKLLISYKMFWLLSIALTGQLP